MIILRSFDLFNAHHVVFCILAGWLLRIARLLKIDLKIPIFSWRLTNMTFNDWTWFWYCIWQLIWTSSTVKFADRDVFNDLLPDTDGADDFLKSLDIPAQETCSNVPISKLMCQFPVPMISNCQNIPINYNSFPRKWLSFISLHTFLFYCYSCWINCLLLKLGSYIIFIRPQIFLGHIMVWRSRRRLCTFFPVILL